MAKKGIILGGIIAIVLILLSLQSVSAVCTCSAGSDFYYQGGTASFSCSCSDATEKNKAYTITWYNTTNNAKEIDTGTTPTTAGQIFSETYLIPSNADIGRWNVSLALAGVYQTEDTFNVTNSSSLHVLVLSEYDYKEELTLGEYQTLRFETKTDSLEEIVNGKCRVTILDAEDKVLDSVYGLTWGGDGHVQLRFDSNDWKLTEKDLINTQARFYIECVCLAGCSAVYDAEGCCASNNGTLITKAHYSDRYIPFDIVADNTRLSDYQYILVGATFIFILSLYFFFAKTWEFELMARGKGENRANIFKLVFMYIAIWSLMPLVNYIMMMADYQGAGTHIASTILLLYRIVNWVNWIASAFLFVFFLYNVLLYFGVDMLKSFKKGQGGKL